MGSASVSIFSRLGEALRQSEPAQKAAATRRLVEDWRAGHLDSAPIDEPWPSPGHRARPILADPATMPRRGLGTVAGRSALLHAICHIELNAIDLALDMAGRFGCDIPMEDRSAFLSDWLSVADDEARHFTMVSKRLEAMGTLYGDLPAHAGLWDAARRTTNDVLARLAIAPMVLEARGLDVTPGMIEKLTRQKDAQSVAVLQVIYDEEVGHVAIGTKWFRYVCELRGIEPEATFAAMVAAHFPGGLKSPFNHPARERSDFPRDWYEGLTSV